MPVVVPLARHAAQCVVPHKSTVDGRNVAPPWMEEMLQAETQTIVG